MNEIIDAEFEQFERLVQSDYMQYYNRAKRALSQKRFNHSVMTAFTGQLLAQKHGQSRENAIICGLLHDITKELSDSEQLIIINKYDIMLKWHEKDTPKLWHPVTAAALCRHEFSLSEQIANAVLVHQSGSESMTELDKVVFLADYIEPTRDFSGVEEVRALAWESLDRAMFKAVGNNIIELIEKNCRLNQGHIETYNRFHGA